MTYFINRIGVTQWKLGSDFRICLFTSTTGNPYITPRYHDLLVTIRALEDYSQVTIYIST